MNKLNLLFITPLFLLFQFASAQQSNLETKIDIWVCCDLDAAIENISETYHIKFNYDQDQLRKISYTGHPNQALNTFLDGVCRKNKLKYFEAKDHTIWIVDKWFETGQETIQEEKTFVGAPTKNNFSISGQIVDESSLESLPFVAVTVKGTNKGTVSNVDGYFTLLDVPTDTSTIAISYIGYQKKELFLSPQSITKNIIITLQQESLLLNEVSITAERQGILQISKQQASVYKMSPLKLQGLPNLGEKDILRSFQLMPGISAANENSSGLYVRGGTPDQVLVLYDGFTVYNVEHMFGFFSAFNSNAIKDVQLFKGGFDAKYGGRLASVVEITGKDGNQRGFNMAADVSMLSVNGFIELPIGNKITATLSGRRSWKSPLYDKIFDQYTDDNSDETQTGFRLGGGTQQTSSFFYDMNAKVTYKPTTKDRIAFSFYNGKDELDNSLTPNTTGKFGGSLSVESVDLTSWGNTGASLKWSRQFNDYFFMNTLVSYSNYYSLRDKSTNGSFVRPDGSSNNFSRGLTEDNNLLDYTAKVDFEYQLNKNNHLEFGLQAIHNDINYTFINADTLTVIDRNTKGQTYTTYLQDKLSLFNGKLTITPGLRYNYFTETAKSYWEPRLISVFNINDRWRIKASYGDYYQFASRVVREDVTGGSRDFWVLADDDQLPVSSSKQFILGAAYETPNYLFDVEGFYKDMNNITEYSLRIQTDRTGIDYSENFFSGYGTARGIDFLIQKKYGNFTGWAAYTWSQVIHHINAYGDYDFFAAHDVTHELKLVGIYKWRNWDFGATWIFATGKPYTSPEGGYELTLLDGTTEDFINVSVKNGNRLPDYHRLDLSANYNFTIGKKSPASIGFSIFNAYNRANVWYNEYEIIDNEVIETPVYFLNFTPNLSFSIKLK